MGVSFIRGAHLGSHGTISRAAVFLVAVGGLVAASAAERTESIQGVWEGRYSCGQGATGVTLTIRGNDPGQVEARFRFYALPGNPHVPSGEYELSGKFDPDLDRVDLHPSKWVNQPPGYTMVGVQGTLEGDRQSLKGTIDAPSCGLFVLTRAGAGAAQAAPVPVQSSAQAQTPSIQAKSKEELDRLTQQAIQLFKAGKYDEALAIGKRALVLAEQLYGPDHLEVVPNLKLVVFILSKAERSAEAVPFMQRVLAIEEKSLGPDHPTVARDLYTLAMLLGDVNRFCEEEPLLRRALAIDEKNLGPDDPAIAADRDALANALYVCKPSVTDANRRMMLLTGQLPAVLVWAVPLAFVTSFMLLWIYLSAVKRSMRRHGGINTSEPTSGATERTSVTRTPALPLDIVTMEDAAGRSPTSLSERRALVGPLRSAAVYAFAGLGYAAMLAALYLYAGGLEFSPLRLLVIALTYAWPVVLTVGLVAAISWRSGLATAAIYFSIFAAVSIVALAVSDNLTWDQLIRFWGLMNLTGTVLILAFLPRQIRAVGPMVLVFMIASVFGSTVWENVLGTTADPRLRQVVKFLVSLGLGDQTAHAIQLAGILILSLIGWALLRWIGRLYRLHWISDQSMIIDSVWLLFTVDHAIDFAFFVPAYFLAPFAAFAIYKTIVLLGFAFLRQAPADLARDPKLLLLRVFSLGRRSALLLNSFGKLWRYAGSIRLIAGPDLATSTVEPHEFLDFLSGRLSRRFISGPETLARRLAETKPRRDFDGRYRVGEFFCYDDSWKMVLGRLARDSDAVLMDLRGFSPANSGCIFEINELLNVVPLTRVVFVVDETTDEAFLQETLSRGWGARSADSPNRALATPRVHVFQFTGSGDGSVPSLVRVIAGAAHQIEDRNTSDSQWWPEEFTPVAG